MVVNKVSSRILINKKDYCKMINPAKTHRRVQRLQLDNDVMMISSTITTWKQHDAIFKRDCKEI